MFKPGIRQGLRHFNTHNHHNHQLEAGLLEAGLLEASGHSQDGQIAGVPKTVELGRRPQDVSPFFISLHTKANGRLSAFPSPKDD
jgi:hypothetical protein